MSTRTILRGAVAFLATLLLSASAHAQLFRAYLASDGNDANPCTLPQPCRLLPAALTAVASGGEIWMLDSANYNTATVTIGKSVSILAIPGAVGSVAAIGGPAIFITAAGLKVALRNLVIVPLPGGAGTKGVYMSGASALTIERSLLANLPEDGVYVAGTGTVKVVDTILRNNGGYAVSVEGGATGTISRTLMLGNFGGVLTYGNVLATTNASVSDSVISGATFGVRTYSVIAGASARTFVTRSTIEGAGTALRSETTGVGSAEIAVGGSMVVNNNDAWYQLGAGSAILSLVDNQMTGNAGSVGTMSPLAPQ